MVLVHGRLILHIPPAAAGCKGKITIQGLRTKAFSVNYMKHLKMYHGCGVRQNKNSTDCKHHRFAITATYIYMQCVITAV